MSDTEDVFVEALVNDVFDEDDDEESSSSSSSSNAAEFPQERRIIHKSNSKFIEVQIPKYDDIEFQQHFRLSRETAYHIIDLIRVANIFPLQKDGREKITPDKGFLMTLWYLANTVTFRQISNRFDVSYSTAHRYINLVVNFLVDKRHNFIKWPSEEQYTAIAYSFLQKRQMKNVIGCIDGSHIPIARPAKDQEAYCNRKGYHSIILQGICDHNKKFLDIYAGEPGSLHDARVLKKSKIYKLIYENKIKMGRYHLLGDSAYPNQNWLVTPFKDNGMLTENHKLFNFRHSSTRMVIENSFGLLKSRFRRLKKFENLNIAFVAKSVTAACVLHNICIDRGDNQIETERDNCEDQMYMETVQEFEEQATKRDILFNEMFS